MKKKGYALLVVIIVMSAALMIGFTIIRSQAIQTNNLKYEKKDLQAYYAAEAGINDLVDKLFVNIKTVGDSYHADSNVTIEEFIEKVNEVNKQSSEQAKILNKSLENDKDTRYNAFVTEDSDLPLETEPDKDNRIYFTYPISSTGESNLKDSIKHTLNRSVTIAVTITSSGGSGGSNIDGIDANGISLLTDAIEKISNYQSISSSFNENEVVKALDKLIPYWQKIKNSNILKNIFNSDHVEKDNCKQSDNWSKFVRDVEQVLTKHKVNGKFSSVHHLDIINNKILNLINDDNTNTITIDNPVITK